MHRFGIACLGGVLAVVGAQLAPAAAFAVAPAPTVRAATSASVARPSASVVLELAPRSTSTLRALAAANRMPAAERSARLRLAIPAAATVDSVVQRARALGLTIQSVNAFSIRVGGSPALINSVFGRDPLFATGLGRNTRSGTVVPTTLRGFVTDVVTSDQSSVKVRPLLTGGPATTAPRTAAAGEVDGSRARALYGAPASTGTFGPRRLTIATLQFSGWNKSDLTAYAAAQLPGLPDPVASGQYVGINVTGNQDVPDNSGGDIEVALDQESLLATAPQANQRAYFAYNGGTSDFVSAIDQVATDALTVSPPITALSISWGACENPTVGFGSNDVSVIDIALQNLTAAGVTVFAAAGDAGAYDCSRASPSYNATFAVDYPGSSPHVISVGGLTTGLPSTPGSPAESVWGSGAPVVGGPAPVGGGGGQSIYESRPAWQSGLTISGSMRLVPDISLSADPASGYFAIHSSNTQCSGGWCGVGGTSLAAPLAAATMTDLQLGTGNSQWGEIGPLLYGAAASPGAFRDITSGSNGFVATAGYDEASGLGAPNWSGIWWSGELPIATKATWLPQWSRSSKLFAAVPAAPLIPGNTGVGYRSGIGTPPIDTSSGWSSTQPTGLATGSGAVSAWLQYKYTDGTVLTLSGSTTIDDVAPAVGVSAALTPLITTRGTIAWTGTDAGSGVSSFTVQLYRNGIAAPVINRAVAAGATRSLVLTFARGYTYTVRVSAVDRTGNRSGTVSATLVVPLNSAAFAYTGRWARRATASSIDGIRYDSVGAGSTAAVTYSARAFQLLATTCSTCGIANVYVDGRLRASVSTFSPTTRYLAPVYSATFAAVGRHTITVQVTGRRAAASRGTMVIVNGLMATSW